MNWAAKYFGDSWTDGGTVGGATAEVGGTDWNPSCTLTKTESDAMARKQRHTAYEVELATLCLSYDTGLQRMGP
eukprot:m.500618 g.500618  ORF g.500618 m.500618 type:complete len:74 (-) comp197276_c0_seq1:20-241(-)